MVLSAIEELCEVIMPLRFRQEKLSGIIVVERNGVGGSGKYSSTRRTDKSESMNSAREENQRWR